MAVASDSVSNLVSLIVKDTQIYSDSLALIGMYYASKAAISITWSLYEGLKVFVLPKIWRTVDFKNAYGEWAVVTGSSDSIGRAYVEEFACRGLNIVLIGQNVFRLNSLSRELAQEYGIDIRVIQADFTRGIEAYPHIVEALHGLDIGILVNNVDVIPPYPQYLVEMSERLLWDHINVNIATVTMMTHIVLPRMIIKKKGAIINFSSIAALGPSPLLAVYSATKAYVEFFSRGVAQECRESGVIIQTLTPSYVNTNNVAYRNQLQKAQIIVPSASCYVRHAISTLGVSEYSTGYWLHSIQYWFLSLFPHSMWMYAVKAMNLMFRREVFGPQCDRVTSCTHSKPKKIVIIFM